MKKLILLFFSILIVLTLFSQNNTLHFDGINDLVIGSSNSVLDQATGTVELWVKPTSKPNSQTFICYRSDNGSQTKFLWNFLGNLSGLGFWNGSFFNTIDYTFTSGEWYHLAFVGESTHTKVYINGVYEDLFIIPFGSATGGSLKLVLGNDIPGGEFFHGEMEEVRIWNRTLCADEISSYMNCDLVDSEPGLITHYNFNQGIAGGSNASVTTLPDLSSTGVDGTLTNFSLDGVTSNWISSTNGVSGSCTSLVCPPSHTFRIHYLITSDYAYVQAEHDEIIQSMAEIQGWYQAATSGKTFQMINPANPNIVNLPNTSVYYEPDYWGRIQQDMTNLGYSTFVPGTIDIYFIKGGGGVALGAQFCGVDCGLAMFGMDIYPQFNTGQFFNCPAAAGGVAAFPCTPKGAVTHEIGHTLGLPHPNTNSSTSAVANHSVMQTHWNFPYNFAPPTESPWGLLTTERQTVRSNPFFYDEVFLSQKNEDLPIVNLPNTGIVPTADFTFLIDDKTVTFTNNSINNIDNYWTLGDEAISHEINLVYTFAEYGNYTVRLRTINSNGMMAMEEVTLAVTTALPLDLLEFKATKKSNEVNLSWETENEINVSEFEIFKSIDARNWEKIGAVAAKGRSENYYEYIDTHLENHRIIYYQLKMIDFDESFERSPIRVVNLEQLKDQQPKIYPNPITANQSLFIEDLGFNNVIAIYIINFVGDKVIHLSQAHLVENGSTLELSLPSLENGVYFLKIELHGSSVFERLVVIE